MSFSLPDVSRAYGHVDVTATPHLKVHAAFWSTLDLTESVRGLIRNQTLNLNYNDWQSYGWPDPAVGINKTLSILYQYGDFPLQISVTNANTGAFSIRPDDPPRDQYILNYRHGHRNIISVIWGTMAGGKTLPESVTKFIAENGSFPATNTFFTFDGEPNVVKTAQVFYQHKDDGPIKCTVGWENTTVTLL
ncbi:hypothetical protein GYMLUDRAFT_73802 [Collybiopsis luxurians FD-317 M1]|uniref:Uncharacterized protein n=1 Tax=Collybiopsis luxurians FD-317 M1 TaxID=944289 RepID=A0A0D0CW66_9AGAR|nr:hypothetical protein GYMLUDRAFT_73802 [Collybiopsis luxurians FD-317 M1]